MEASTSRSNAYSPLLEGEIGSPGISPGRGGGGSRSSSTNGGAPSSPGQEGGIVASIRGRTLEAARYLRRGARSRFMIEQSVVVREAAAEQLGERQTDWAYSRPVVVMDLLWNFAFVSVAAVVLAFSVDEKPQTPLRMWVIGYAVQCVVHMSCVWSEYRRRRDRRRHSTGNRNSSARRAGGQLVLQQQQQPVATVAPGIVSVEGQNSNATGGRSGAGRGDSVETRARGRVEMEVWSEEEGAEATGREMTGEEMEGGEGPSLAEKLKSANTIFSFHWYCVGLWLVIGGITGEGFRHAPLLCWLCIVFLAINTFFVVVYVALAWVIAIFIAIFTCCCLPCLIVIHYAVAGQEGQGASEDEIQLGALPKDKFRKRQAAGTMTSVAASGLHEPVSLLQENLMKPEDAECCICLSPYDDDVELRQLPCSHHFHCQCIDKWLRTKPTCPLCKFDIVKGMPAAATSTTGTSTDSASETDATPIAPIAAVASSSSWGAVDNV
eukprot:TRINITY_DN2231_c0_g2_i2.p1 TRINITY_DN2231_c0_g2~~TRINITY_DN2231_c0_g2_i2.p1  ORF type:complete len:494 (+),score=110.41 TRINITY_DN2231_c0_g2_i2:860-2341(+)